MDYSDDNGSSAPVADTKRLKTGKNLSDELKSKSKTTNTKDMVIARKNLSDELKRLVHQYYNQLTKGCERCECENINCASNPKAKKLDKKKKLLSEQWYWLKKGKKIFASLRNECHHRLK